MNHTLQSLLITSMLTIPTVFASHDSLLATNSDTQPAAAATACRLPMRPELIAPALIKKADSFRYLGMSTKDSEEKLRFHTESAKLYEDAAKHAVFPEFIRRAANNVSCLVAPVSDRALPLFELFLNKSDVTPWHIRDAADTLNNFKGTHGSNSAERLRHIKKVIKLFELSTTHLESTLRDTFYAADKLRIFGEKEKKPEEKVLYLDASAAFYEQGANHPATTVNDILFEAKKSSDLGDSVPWDNLQLHIKASILFKLAANHPDATPENIRFAADGLNALANKYPEDSAESLRGCTR